MKFQVEMKFQQSKPPNLYEQDHHNQSIFRFVVWNKLINSVVQAYTEEIQIDRNKYVVQIQLLLFLAQNIHLLITPMHNGSNIFLLNMSKSIHSLKLNIRT